MSFLQPWMLIALPIAALPVIIHLINQRRFQSINWAAMRFLLEANRMSRGYARIRQWLILLFRVLAIAALVFMISRPLATGWLGLAGGGRPDTTLVLIDRSASMTQHGVGSAQSKLENGVALVAQTLATLGSSRWVVIDSVSHEPRELQSPAELIESPGAQPSSAAADLSTLLQAAHDYIKNNRTGQTEVWICSDLRANDWNAESGRWEGIRNSFQEFKQSVRFHLIAYSAVAADNLAVRVTDVQRRSTGEDAALFLSLRLTRADGGGKRSVPIHFDVEGARSELTVEMEGHELDLKNHRIPLAGDRVQGWGQVAIPADENPADNEFYFVFDELPSRRCILVTEDRAATRALELAASISPDPAVSCSVELVDPEHLAGIVWESVALVLWQARLPEDDAASAISRFVNRGGQVMFLPPSSPGNEALFGTRWTTWESPPEPVRVESWRGDQDLLARTQSGAALPVGELIVRRYCGLEGEFTTLAKLYGGATLLGRVTTDRGGVYFCASTASPSDTSFGTEGVSLYVAIQRALAAGAAELALARLLAAGNSFPSAGSGWQQLAGSSNSLSTEYPFHAGVYTAEKQMLAVNRSEEEDRAATLSETLVAELFRGLDFDLVNDQAGNMHSLAREVWRLCIGAMVLALVAEAGLCLLRKPRQTGVSS
ncbi:MAG TPA: BatA domain-containing protein [Lacipirellulaceae bacterium]